MLLDVAGTGRDIEVVLLHALVIGQNGVCLEDAAELVGCRRPADFGDGGLIESLKCRCDTL